MVHSSDATPTERRSSGERPKAHVLVVEDDSQLRRIIVANLRARGHEVREVEAVAEAIEALGAEQPDLLVLDVNLPDGTGWDVLRQAQPPAEVRVLMLTAVPVSPRRLAEFRPVAYLPKPFPLDALLRLAESETRTVAEDA
jgi:DNA-binding response OmpR family regulator